MVTATQRLIIGILVTIIGGFILAVMVAEVRNARATASDLNTVKIEVQHLKSAVFDLQHKQK